MVVLCSAARIFSCAPGAAVERRAPALRVRRNYPYTGKSDGLTAYLRRRFDADRYLGIELEINQAQVAGKGWRRLQGQIAQSLRELVP